MLYVLAGIAMLILPFLYWLSSPEDARPKRPWQVLYGPLPKHGSGSPTLEGRVLVASADPDGFVAVTGQPFAPASP